MSADDGTRRFFFVNGVDLRGEHKFVSYNGCN
ncbi:hypothetical protein LMG29739_04495 [Paraburkholderia solisilvae]|uniref:Uncharacterized protein n=1 Tax=Paraburkholderia solisilvae TaxID=624376 RepID=A0A6J5EJ47_9BURK|nr:hypothetical protein LMG29739_04495 [Paraburkholderia solisilvae]